MSESKILKFLQKNKHVWVVPIFGLFYLISFILLEQSNCKINVIHCGLDDIIPFCEYFIIPYLLWFVFVAVTVCFFAFVCKNRREYYRLIATLGTGMVVFLIVSFVYPNGHNLRPELYGDNIFIKAVKILYLLDTPTNILPSLHVFCTVACYIAILKNRELRNRKGLVAGNGILAVCIIASTMFLKQHSIIDGLFALGMNAFCYVLFYRLNEKYEAKLAVFLTRKEVCTIPNLLSMFRLILAVLILGISQRWGIDEKRNLMIGILIVSAVTDFLDGKIARKYHMVSEVGKILDPVADKVTQAVVLICFIDKYPIARSMLLLFVIKEAVTVTMGAKAVLKTHENEGAMWYGKVNTAVFYGVMTILMFVGNIPEEIAELLFQISMLCMMLACSLYIRQFNMKINNVENERSEIDSNSLVG